LGYLRALRGIGCDLKMKGLRLDMLWLYEIECSGVIYEMVVLWLWICVSLRFWYKAIIDHLFEVELM
jgi:hypothetical protein